MKIRQLFSKALAPKAAAAERPASKKASGAPPTYELVEGAQLGEGGYGKVYEAIVHGDPEARVAIKKIPLSRVREESLHREVRIGRELNHPNIVRVLDSYVQGPDFYMVMELVKGGELFERVIGLGMMSEAEAANHFGQLLLAVHHCHSKGVAHRDIKLENVLLQPGGAIKLIDFGLAALHDVVGGRPVPRVLRDKCGSKSYAAPEVNGGKGYNGFAADVWSLAICLFAMLAGFFPLDEAKEQDWRFRRFCRAEAAGQSVCAAIFGFYGRECPFSAEAVALLEGMLRANPYERLRVDELLASPWLRRNAAPRVRALIEVTLHPLPVALAHAAHAERLDELLRPHSAPVVSAARAAAAGASPRQPLTPPAQQTAQSTLQANLGRAYAALSAVVATSRGGHTHAASAATAGDAAEATSSAASVGCEAVAARLRPRGAGGARGAVPIEHGAIPPPPPAADSRKRRPQRGAVAICVGARAPLDAGAPPPPSVPASGSRVRPPSPMEVSGRAGSGGSAQADRDGGHQPHVLPPRRALQPGREAQAPRGAPVYRSMCVNKATLDAALADADAAEEAEVAAAAAEEPRLYPPPHPQLQPDAPPVYRSVTLCSSCGSSGGGHHHEGDGPDSDGLGRLPSPRWHVPSLQRQRATGGSLDW